MRNRKLRLLSLLLATVMMLGLLAGCNGGGEEGVKCYIDKLAGELADTMQMCGAHSIAEITPDMVRAK